MADGTGSAAAGVGWLEGRMLTEDEFRDALSAHFAWTGKVEMLGYLIETHGVKQGDVAAGTGLADSTVSQILAGKRKMNVRHIEALARFFKVERSVFLDE